MADQPTLSVTGSALVGGTPDQCRLHISLNHIAATAADALTATAAIASEAIAALGQVLIEQCDVQTVGLSIQDFFDKSEQKVTARIGTYQLDVTIRPVDETGGVLAALSAAVGDALQIRGINLAIEDPEPMKREARRLAILDAKNKAAQIADEVGVALGAIVAIHDDSASPNRRVQGTTFSAMSATAAANVPIEAGSIWTSGSVTLIYALEG